MVTPWGCSHLPSPPPGSTSATSPVSAGDWGLAGDRRPAAPAGTAPVAPSPAPPRSCKTPRQLGMAAGAPAPHRGTVTVPMGHTRTCCSQWPQRRAGGGCGAGRLPAGSCGHPVSAGCQGSVGDRGHPQRHMWGPGVPPQGPTGCSGAGRRSPAAPGTAPPRAGRGHRPGAAPGTRWGRGPVPGPPPAPAAGSSEPKLPPAPPPGSLHTPQPRGAEVEWGRKG